MCVGRYAEKTQWSEAKWNLFEPLARSSLFGQMPAIDMLVLCIPAECDNIKKPYNGEIASRWDACLLCYICRHFASVMLHVASLISHNLRCIPAYAHQIPTGFFKSLLNYHRDNMYIIPFFCMMRGPNGGGWVLFVLRLSGYGFSPKVFHFLASDEKRVGEFFMGELV